MNRLDQSLVSGIPGQAARLKRGTRLVLGLLDSLEGGAIDVNLPGGLSRRVGRGPCVAHLSTDDENVFDEILAKVTSALPRPGWPAAGTPMTCRRC